MSTSTTAPAPAGPVRRHRTTLLLVAGLVAAVAVVLLAGTDDRRSGYLDPANPDPDGAQAVARVLEDQGVDVTVARGVDELDDGLDAGAGRDTTVVVTSTELLGESTSEPLVDAAAAGSRVVLVEPGSGLPSTLGVPDPVRHELEDPVAADCPDASYDGLELSVDSAYAYPGPGCFASDDGVLLAQPRAGVEVLGAGQAMTNDQVLRGDNAALALRLLGGSDRLVWYVPSLDDLTADDGVSASSLLPDWLKPALWLGLAAALALMAWRSRRLGPLAVEPLPVAVKAIETTRSRGRLYRKAGDRSHAAAVLRGAARARAADRLQLGRHADPDAIVREVARHTGRPLAEVDALLGPRSPAPATDKDLITLADRLAELDREGRRP